MTTGGPALAGSGRLIEATRATVLSRLMTEFTAPLYTVLASELFQPSIL